MEILVFAIIAIALGGFGSARLIRSHKLRKRPSNLPIRKRRSLSAILKEIYPDINLAIDGVSDSAGGDQTENKDTIWSKIRKDLDSLSVISALGESAFVGAEAFHNYLAIDHHMFDALSQLTGHQLNSIGDLHSSLDSWKQGFDGGLADKGIDKLQGHVSEFIVADHLRDLGHSVVVAPESNTPGYDLLVDGHPVNVKNVLDMQSIHEHFDKYPDIGVITNADLGATHEGMLHFDPTQGIDASFYIDPTHSTAPVFSDMSLHHAVVVDQVHDATDAVSGHIDLHFPIITLALSSFREVGLLFNDHTDFMTSLKNVGLDTAGTGIGGAIGAKGGAAIGTMIFPGLGTVVGAILGGIGGALVGRYGTNKIKQIPLKGAIDQYQAAMGSLETSLKESDAEAKRILGGFVDRETTELKQVAQLKQSHLKSLTDTIQQAETKAYVWSSEHVEEEIKQAKQRLHGELRGVEVSIEKLGVWSRYVWPSNEYVRLDLLKKQIKKEIEELALAEQQFNAASNTLSPSDLTNLGLELLCSFGAAEERIREHLQAFKEVKTRNRANFDDSVQKAKIEVADRRRQAFERIAKEVERLKEWVRSRLKPAVDSATGAKEEVLKEQRKLGLA